MPCNRVLPCERVPVWDLMVPQRWGHHDTNINLTKHTRHQKSASEACMVAGAICSARPQAELTAWNDHCARTHNTCLVVSARLRPDGVPGGWRPAARARGRPRSARTRTRTHPGCGSRPPARTPPARCSTGWPPVATNTAAYRHATVSRHSGCTRGWTTCARSSQWLTTVHVI